MSEYMWKINAGSHCVGDYQELPCKGITYRWTGKNHVIQGVGFPKMQISDGFDATKCVEALVNAEMDFNLIAAAPDMLEALEFCLIELKLHNDERSKPYMRMAEAAIHKARGKN